jgi:hypothetical protein
VLDRHRTLARERHRALPALAPQRLGRRPERVAPGADVGEDGVEPVAGGPYEPLLDLVEEGPMSQYQAAARKGGRLLHPLIRNVEPGAARHPLAVGARPGPPAADRFEQAVDGVEKPGGPVAAQVEAAGARGPAKALARAVSVRERDGKRRALVSVRRPAGDPAQEAVELGGGERTRRVAGLQVDPPAAGQVQLRHRASGQQLVKVGGLRPLGGHLLGH